MGASALESDFAADPGTLSKSPRDFDSSLVEMIREGVRDFNGEPDDIFPALLILKSMTTS
jgi:hypothetical protein